MVAEALFCTKSSDYVPERSKRFDRMLRVVVVPRDPVIAEKREQLVSILFQTLLDLHRCLTVQVAFGDPAVKLLHRREVLLQETALEAVPIDSFDHGLEQDRKS
jgi:hypothetical protein